MPALAGMSLRRCLRDTSSCCRGPACSNTHIQLPEERLQLVSVLELRAEFLVQVCIHLLQELLGILGVFLKLQKGQASCERGSCWNAEQTHPSTLVLSLPRAGTATGSYDRHVDTRKYLEKGKELPFPMLRTTELSRHPRAAYSVVFSCSVVKSHLSLPSLPFQLDSITTACDASAEEAEPSPSTHKPPPGAVILSDPHKRHCLGWAPQFSFGNRLITSTHPGCGRGIQPDLLPAEPPWLVDAIYPQTSVCRAQAGAEPQHRAPGAQLCFLRVSFPRVDLFHCRVEHTKSPLALFWG